MGRFGLWDRVLSVSVSTKIRLAQDRPDLSDYRLCAGAPWYQRCPDRRAVLQRDPAWNLLPTLTPPAEHLRSLHAR